MTLSLVNCWVCGKPLSEKLPEELYFWCNKECYDKDDLYHGRRAAVQTKKWEDEENKIKEKIMRTKKEVNFEKEERKKKIREALKKEKSTSLKVCSECKGEGWIDNPSDHMRNLKCKKCSLSKLQQKKESVKSRKSNKQKKTILTSKKNHARVKG